MSGSTDGVWGLTGAQSQLLNEAILKRLVHALDATLHVRRVGANDVDVSGPTGAPELVRPLAHLGGAGDAVFVVKATGFPRRFRYFTVDAK
jgi:hypothetical protein